MQQPSPDNAHLVLHAELLRRSHRSLTGRDLVDPSLSAEAAAEALYFASFVLLSHGNDPDPLMGYANRAGLELFELSWEQLIVMPSRLTAEAAVREERARLRAKSNCRDSDTYRSFRSCHPPGRGPRHGVSPEGDTRALLLLAGSEPESRKPLCPIRFLKRSGLAGRPILLDA